MSAADAPVTVAMLRRALEALDEKLRRSASVADTIQFDAHSVGVAVTAALATLPAAAPEVCAGFVCDGWDNVFGGREHHGPSAASQFHGAIPRNGAASAECFCTCGLPYSAHQSAEQPAPRKAVEFPSDVSAKMEATREAVQAEREARAHGNPVHALPSAATVPPMPRPRAWRSPTGYPRPAVTSVVPTDGEWVAMIDEPDVLALHAALADALREVGRLTDYAQYWEDECGREVGRNVDLGNKIRKQRNAIKVAMTSLESLTVERDGHKQRADDAEARVRELEAQLAERAREAERKLGEVYEEGRADTMEKCEPLVAALHCALATMDAVAATSDFHQCGLARQMASDALEDFPDIAPSVPQLPSPAPETFAATPDAAKWDFTQQPIVTDLKARIVQLECQLISARNCNVTYKDAADFWAKRADAAEAKVAAEKRRHGETTALAAKNCGLYEDAKQQWKLADERAEAAEARVREPVHALPTAATVPPMPKVYDDPGRFGEYVPAADVRALHALVTKQAKEVEMWKAGYATQERVRIEHAANETARADAAKARVEVLEAQLAERGEPVAMVNRTFPGAIQWMWMEGLRAKDGTKLYAAPPPDCSHGEPDAVWTLDGSDHLGPTLIDAPGNKRLFVGSTGWPYNLRRLLAGRDSVTLEVRVVKP